MTYQLQSTTDIEGTFATGGAPRPRFVTRQALQQALDERSNGRLHLDPQRPQALSRQHRTAWLATDRARGRLRRA